MNTPATEKHEIVCIVAPFMSTEGERFAAKITYLSHTPGTVYDPRKGVKQERLIPIPGYWG